MTSEATLSATIIIYFIRVALVKILIYFF